MGITSIIGFAVLILLAFFVTDLDIRFHPETGEEIGQFDAVRLLYLHVHMAIVTYLAFVICAIASAGYLIKRTLWWD